MQASLTFNRYVMAVCKYAYLEYDFGIQSNAAVFQLDQSTVEHLGFCWSSCVPIPDAANYVARKIKS